MDKRKRHICATVKALEGDDDGIFEAFASTESVDRHGEIVRASGFKKSLARHKKNGTHPKVLAAHAHYLESGEPSVVGWSLHEEIIEDTGLKVRFKFAPMDAYPPGTTPLGPIYDRFYRMKLMDALSIGFIPEKMHREDAESPLEHRQQDLLEYSPVAVPSNRESLVAMAAGEGMEAQVAGLALKHLVPVDVAQVKDVNGEGAKEAWTLVSLKALVDECTDELRSWLGIDRALMDRKIDETENEFRFRVRNPGLFQEDSFRRRVFQKSPKIDATFGKLKDEDTMTLQSLQFPKDAGWTESKVHDWLKEHEGDLKEATFEEAADDDGDAGASGDDAAEAAMGESASCACGASRMLSIQIDMEQVVRVERAAKIIEAKAEQVTGLVERLDTVSARVERLGQEYDRLLGLAGDTATVPKPVEAEQSRFDEGELAKILVDLDETRTNVAALVPSRNGDS